MKYPENHLQDMTLVIRQISSSTLITGEFLMFRKLTVIAATALACSGAMAATETFTFNTAGQTPISFSGSIFGQSLSNVLLDNATTGVSLVGGAGGYSSYLFSVNSTDLSHTLSWNGTNLGSAGNWTSVQSTGTLPVLTNTPAVPEPETYAMMLAGLGALGFVGRRRKAK